MNNGGSHPTFSKFYLALTTSFYIILKKKTIESYSRINIFELYENIVRVLFFKCISF